MVIWYLVRFAHIWIVGILEYWNNGFWDASAIIYWENEPDKNIKKQETSFKKHYPDIPTFHYSMYSSKTQIS